MLGADAVEYLRGKRLGVARSWLAEPRPDPGRFVGIGNYVATPGIGDFTTVTKWAAVGAVALLGGFLLMLWKDAKRPVLRRNPRRHA